MIKSCKISDFRGKTLNADDDQAAFCSYKDAANTPRVQEVTKWHQNLLKENNGSVDYEVLIEMMTALSMSRGARVSEPRLAVDELQMGENLPRIGMVLPPSYLKKNNQSRNPINVSHKLIIFIPARFTIT